VQENEEDEQAQAKLTAAIETSERAFSSANDHMVAFVEAARIDIGSYSKDDEIINRENREAVDATADAEPSKDALSPSLQTDFA
jgi:hypothetical protein